MKKFKEALSGHKKIMMGYEKTADKVLTYDAAMQAMTDAELKAMKEAFQDRLKKGETLDDILPEAFAVVREGARRVLGLHPYRVQIIGGLALHDGNIAEMKTGEGKTLTATMPVYLNALSGKGVHVVTVNDYLSSRDKVEMGELYEFLGLTVGLNTQGMQADEKRDAYEADITYSTNNELGFDYLRDNMAPSLAHRVQRTLNYAVVDEVDSILIDEARTPLIISGLAAGATSLYVRADYFAKQLVADTDYEIDLESKAISLTEAGMDKAEKLFRIDNLYSEEHTLLIHHIDKALQANYIMITDKDYVVDEGLIKIVDTFTGRIMEGRQYSDGLHQAIEAKEGVEIQKETKTMASITYQNLFRMYEKLSGMTGTGKTEEEELREIYSMEVIVVPTNKPIIRDDKVDVLYPSLKGKYQAVIKDIQARHEAGQPVLVGTASVETSEYLGSLLDAQGIPHEVLNAKNHHREADIIVNAGWPGAVTIATNMAGRGTDIKLGPGVRELGGLAVIGTERHESRRIDNQLRGRSGRQGDPGVSQFYLSLEDELMVRFGANKLKDFLSLLSTDDEEMPLESKMLAKQVKSAQERVEGNNYDARKSVLNYDDVMRIQREVMYRDRLKVLTETDLTYIITGIHARTVARAIETHLPKKDKKNWHIEKMVAFCHETLNLPAVTAETFLAHAGKKNKTALQAELVDAMADLYESKMTVFTYPEQRTSFEKSLLLRIVDDVWTNHIDFMEALKEGIGLRSYAQNDPIVAYQEDGTQAFESMKAELEDAVTRMSMHAMIHAQAGVAA